MAAWSAVSLDLLVSAWDEESEVISPASSQSSRNTFHSALVVSKEDKNSGGNGNQSWRRTRCVTLKVQPLMID